MIDAFRLILNFGGEKFAQVTCAMNMSSLVPEDIFPSFPIEHALDLLLEIDFVDPHVSSLDESSLAFHSRQQM